MTTPEQQGDTPKVGIGTTQGSTSVANLTNPATLMDLITEQDGIGNGTEEVMALGPTAAIPFVILSGAAHTVYYNVADTWANDTSGDLTADIAGTLTLHWTFLA